MATGDRPRPKWTKDIKEIWPEYYKTGPTQLDNWDDVGKEIDPKHTPPVPEVIPPGAQAEPKPFVYKDDELLSTQLGTWHEDNRKEFTEADLLRLAGQLDLAREQGWVPRWYFPCGDNDHKHEWRIGAWLCKRI